MNPFQPDDLVAAYEWHPFPQFRPGREHRDCFLAVSTPGHAEFPQQGAVWDGQVFRNPADEAQVLTGVTFWAGLPATPEQSRSARSEAQRAAEAGQMDLLQPPATSPA